MQYAISIDEEMPYPCVLAFDNVLTVPKTLITEKITS